MSKPIIQLNEETVKSELKEMVRNSVEETLNALLNKEAEELTSAAKYERTESRQGYRSGHYSRKLTTTSGEVTLNIPKLKGVPFETAIIERYRRRESSVEEALIEMYLAEELHTEDDGQHLDEDEFLTVEKIHIDTLCEMVMRGEIPDAKTQIAVLKVKRLLDERKA